MVCPFYPFRGNILRSSCILFFFMETAFFKAQLYKLCCVFVLSMEPRFPFSPFHLGNKLVPFWNFVKTQNTVKWWINLNPILNTVLKWGFAWPCFRYQGTLGTNCSPSPLAGEIMRTTEYTKLLTNVKILKYIFTIIMFLFPSSTWSSFSLVFHLSVFIYPVYRRPQCRQMPYYNIHHSDS